MTFTSVVQQAMWIIFKSEKMRAYVRAQIRKQS